MPEGHASPPTGGARGAPSAGRFSAAAERGLVAAAALLALAFLLPVVAGAPERVVDYVSDDAYYYLKVARHLAAGDGPTFDGITCTTGFHPLYALLLAAGSTLVGTGERGLVALALALGTAGFLATSIALFRAAAALWSPRAGRWAAILWLSNPHAVLLVVTGMEGSLYALLASGLAAVLASLAASGEVERGTRVGTVAWAGLLAGLCVAARTDALLLAGLAGIWIASACSGRLPARAARALLFALLALMPFALWSGYAAAHTGQWLQGSAGTKALWRRELAAQAGTIGSLIYGAKVFVTWLVKCLAKVPALKWTAPFLAPSSRPPVLRGGPGARRLLHVFWIAPTLLGLAYAVLLPRPWTWYYAPALVLLTVVAAGGIATWIDRRAVGGGGRFARALVPVLLIVAVESYGYLAVKGIGGRNRYQRDVLEEARWIRENLPEDSVVGAWNAGILGWYSDRTVVNLDGLINNEIADVRLGRVGWAEYWDCRGITHLADWEDTFSAVPHRWHGGHLELAHRRPPTQRGSRPLTVWTIVRAGAEAAPVSRGSSLDREASGAPPR